MIEKAFCTTREAAKQLGVSVGTTQMWAENGLLIAWKTVGGHRRISRDSVERLLHKTAATQSQTAPSAPVNKLKVLIVDDDPVLLRLYETRLAQWPMLHIITFANNGIDALIKIGRQTPDLLIADLGMPEMNGFRMLRVLRKIPELAGTTVVVISGLDAQEISRRGVPENITVLPKPVPFAALKDIAYGIWAKKLADSVEVTPCA